MIQCRFPVLPVAVVLGILALGGCRAEAPPAEQDEGGTVESAVGGDAPSDGDTPPDTFVRPDGDPAPDADPVARPDAVHPLTAEGWGPVRIGMTRKELVSVAGEDAHPELVGGPEPDMCDEFRPERMPEGMRVMVEDGRLTRISVGRDSEVRTDAGFGVGATAAEVEAAYGGRVERSAHKYVEAPAAYLTVWTNPPPGPAAPGIVYETGVDARVVHVHAGGPSIQYVEGCL